MILLSFVTVFLVCNHQYVLAREQPATTKPHILMIIVDDLGWADVSFRGSEYTTPTIDELAAQGIILDQYYVQATCSPTRTALLTSRYPYNLGLAHLVVHNGLPMGIGLNFTLLPQVLKQGGYSTHLVGKWDAGYTVWEQTPTFRGFDTFLGYYGAVEDCMYFCMYVCLHG